MFELLRKRIEAKIYSFKIFVKAIIYRKRNYPIEDNCVQNIFTKYNNKKKIVIIASGPSASKVRLNKEHLYLVTNTGNRMVNGYDFLYYLNDHFYINRALANSFLKPGQEVLLFYADTELHKIGLTYLLKFLPLWKDKKLYFFTRGINSANADDNFLGFESFYNERNLSLRIQNSGVFLLLFGYYLAHRLSLPLDIYGLDLGVGGNVHFDRKAVVGKSVTGDRVKVNVRIYLDHMYGNYSAIRNYSNFYGNV